MQHLQRDIDDTLDEVRKSLPEGMEAKCSSFADDIIVWADSEDEMFIQLDGLFQTLEKYGWSVNREKCIFCVSEVDYLGMKITGEGYTIADGKLREVEDMAMPTNRKELKSIIGFLNFLRPFVDNLSEMISPISRFTSPNTEWSEWGEEQESILKECLFKVSNPALIHFVRREDDFVMRVDASAEAYGAALFGVAGDQERRLVGLHSKRFPTASSYSNPVREAYAVLACLQKFRHLIYGREITVETDCKALESFLSKEWSNNVMKRIQQEILLEFDVKIVHIPGKENKIADNLSREMCFIINADWDEEQNLDEDIRLVKLYLSGADVGVIDHATRNRITSWAREMEIKADGTLIKRDARGGERLVVPKERQMDLLEEAHGSGHAGVSRMKTRLRREVWWPRMSTDVEDFVEACHNCSMNDQPTRRDGTGVL